MASYETGLEYSHAPGGDGSAVDSTARAAAAAAATTANAAAVATTQVIAGAGLTGGGTLAADLTLNVVAHADGSIVVAADSVQVGVISAAQHGAQTSTTLHAVATDSLAGFMSAADHATLTANTAAIALKAPISYTLNDQTGTTYTLVLTDAGKLLTLNNASAVALTIPANASVAFPVGTIISCLQKGAGQVTVSITTDTLNNPGLTAKSRGQWSRFTLEKISSTVWVISGDLAAA